MSQTRFGVSEFRPQIIDHPYNSYVVPVGGMAVAENTPEIPYLSTHALYVCKGITVYSPITKRGLLAHLSWTENVDDSLTRITEHYEGEMQTSEVHIVQTVASKDEAYWPTIDRIADFFLQHNPLRITIDTNLESISKNGDPYAMRRAIALDLDDGQIYEVDKISNRISEHTGLKDTSINYPIDPLVYSGE